MVTRKVVELGLLPQRAPFARGTSGYALKLPLQNALIMTSSVSQLAVDDCGATTLSAVPGAPDSPLSPLSPLLPAWPGGPAGPGSPFSPASPFSPLTSLTPSELPARANAASRATVIENARMRRPPGRGYRCVRVFRMENAAMSSFSTITECLNLDHLTGDKLCDDLREAGG